MATLQRVTIKRKSLDDYKPIVGNETVDAIRAVAEELKGVRLLHLNATASGGGVAELLNSLVPLESDCGLDVEWCVMAADQGFFQITKGFHNGLQGRAEPPTEEQRRLYLDRNRQFASEIGRDFQVLIIHDPQPAAAVSFLNDHPAKRIWRCHIDTSEPVKEVWEFLCPYVARYDAAVFTMKEFVPPDLKGPQLVYIPPAIDPISPKNRALPRYIFREVVAEFGVDLARPLIIQVARFDPWKDPMGVIAAYHLAKEQVPNLQLALIGAMAEDDPEAWGIYESVRGEADKDPDIYVFTNLTGVHDHEVNAFQRVADVVVQKSVREGFGLVVSEALWKRTPVVAGKTGGIRLQMPYGLGGFLVESIEEAADRIVYLLGHPDESENIARLGWERVQQHFLMPRLLLDELRLVQSLLDGRSR